MHNWNWDDLRFVLAVADNGSVSNAAKRLGVAHTTVLRRISAFEADTGASLFVRTGDGYSFDHDRVNALRAIRKAGEAVQAAHAEIAERSILPGEAVRITSTDTLCQTVLPVVIERLRGDAPSLKVALSSFNTRLNLAHGQADVTVRPAEKLTDDLEGEIAAELGFAVYEPNAGATTWIGVAGPLTRSVAGKWLEETHPQASVRTDSFVALRELIATGQGRGVLPCILGDADPRLTRVRRGMPRMRTPVWVAGHKNLADTGLLRRTRRRLIKALSNHRAELAG